MTYVGLGSAAALVLLAASFPCRAEDPSSAKKGERIYANNCSTCHGDDLINNSGIAFDLRRLTAGEHDRFVSSVLHGKNAMPPWEGVLGAEQIESLWAYIRANAYK
jgi:cytochrome c oxidase cbb3-type subunit 3